MIQVEVSMYHRCQLIRNDQIEHFYKIGGPNWTQN